MIFAREVLTQIKDEAAPLFDAHYKEIAHYQDIPLAGDWARYKDLEHAHICYTFTVRTDDKKLVGYSVFFVNHHIHYKDSLQALQDVLYIDPSHRGSGLGRKFIQWCDAQLKEQGVQVVLHHVKELHNFGPMLASIGYSPIEKIWGKRL